MNWETWQECPRCGRGRGEQACCLDCEKCEKHCTCEQAAKDAAEIAEFNRANPGYLEQLEKHRQQGAAGQ